MADPTIAPGSRRAVRARHAADGGPSAPAGWVESARQLATDAAEAAEISLHEVDALADLAAVRRVFDTLWSADPTNPAVTVELLRAYVHTGQYVVLATDLTEPGRPVVAASVGFLAAPAGSAVHSNVTGVLPPGRGRSLGFAIKLHQRAWAMERGLTEVTWTFDPLIRRNAWFNLAKLGARAQEYLVDFYGPMADGINAGDSSDRLYVRWSLAAPDVVEACAGRAAAIDVAGLRDRGAAVLLSVADDGRSPSTVTIPPARGAGAGPERDTALAQVPPDIEALRGQDPALGRAWREALRRVLGPALASDWRVSGFGRDGWYVLRREEE